MEEVWRGGFGVERLLFSIRMIGGAIFYGVLVKEAISDLRFQREREGMDVMDVMDGMDLSIGYCEFSGYSLLGGREEML